MIFDPRALGDSATFLFGLGEATEAVIGDKVRTTERELADQLLQAEEHITLVTQKYLQGQHATLTEYNAAAGEVAEPYRFLVLFDYPEGFRRSDGRHDDEALARLGKVIEAGPRCGVFTFLVSGELAARARQAPAPAVSAAQSAPHAPAEAAMPGPCALLSCLFVGRMIQNETFDRLIGVSATPATEVYDLNPGHRGMGAGVQLQLAREDKDPFTLTAVGAHWRFVPDPPLNQDSITDISARVERGLASAADVRVTPARVAELALAKLQRNVARGTQQAQVVPHPDDPSTWWHDSAATGVAATFGRVGAADVAVLQLDSQTFSNVLMGGRPGAGKSVWLHAVISNLCQAYAPSELDLYLVDFKEGVEFKAYAAGRLPHARVVAVESERDFGLSVLASLDAEITRRGRLFRGTDGNQVNLSAYRARTGEALPRIVLIVDEFHVLFERDDKLATLAGEILERIVRQGRAFGVHTLLASQTLAGTAGIGRHLFNLIPVRVALQSSDADSRLLLADDNGDARLLSRPGEGILNTKGGLKDANSRFQTAFWDPEDREPFVRQLRQMADRIGFTRAPVVFEGRSPASVDDLPAEVINGAASPQRVTAPLGLPLTLDGPVMLELRREPGGNLLIVTAEDAAYGLLTLCVTALAAGQVACEILDYASPDAPWAAALAELAEHRSLSVIRSRAAKGRLRELAELVGQRQGQADYRAPARVAIIVGLHRARDFDTAEYDNEGNALLERLLRDGPDVGVHVIAWCDKPVSLDRRLSSAALRDFGLRVLTQTNKDDSFRLIDSDLASNLPAAQAVLDDHDKAVTSRFRWFAMPTADWVARTAAAAP